MLMKTNYTFVVVIPQNSLCNVEYVIRLPYIYIYVYIYIDLTFIFRSQVFLFDHPDELKRLLMYVRNIFSTYVS